MSATTRMVLAAVIGFGASAAAAQQSQVRSGAQAFGDWRSDAPGVRRHIAPTDIPPADMAGASASPSRRVARPNGAMPKVPAGFQVTLFASGLSNPRAVRTAPNGDIFLSETSAGRVRVLRAPDGADKAAQSEVFASGLERPFGIAFPPGPDPRYVYVALETKVLRFPYKAGDLKPAGEPETIIPKLPSGGHSTRDIAFSPDGKVLYVSIGSGSNVAEGLPKLSASQIAENERKNGLGAAWGNEHDRAVVLAFDSDGKNKRTFATGVRNCAGLAVDPKSGAPWCATNERDMLGDNLPFEYATSLKQGGFYGWPWYYIGKHEDPRHKGERPDLADQITMPDVLMQAHSAPLGIAFYEAAAFPQARRGGAFVTLHGSWNRAQRTGYKVVYLPFEGDKPTGDYVDFVTGFVVDQQQVWGRPVGVTVAKDGALIVTDDGGNAVWRVAYKGG
jgi:glucose/arabinose dehydrogenase